MSKLLGAIKRAAYAWGKVIGLVGILLVMAAAGFANAVEQAWEETQ